MGVIASFSLTAFATNILTQNTKRLDSNTGHCLSVATFASAGDRDPVYSWTERPLEPGSGQLNHCQGWDFELLSNGYYAIKPTTNNNLVLNIASYSTGDCNVRLRSVNPTSDYTCACVSLNDNLGVQYAIKLVQRNNVTLTETTTAVTKWSDGDGVDVAWKAYTGGSNQVWMITPNM